MPCDATGRVEVVRLLPTRQNSMLKVPGEAGATAVGPAVGVQAFWVFGVTAGAVSVLMVPSLWAALVPMIPRERSPKNPANTITAMTKESVRKFLGRNNP